MLRKRERFERSDVPRPNPLRPVISLVVIAVTFIILAIFLMASWQKANQMNNHNDSYLDNALYEQLDTRGPTDGSVKSDDEFSNVLILTVDDVNAEDRTLQGAQLLVRNITQNTATLVNLPLNTRMLAGESNVMLSNYFDYAGAAASIAPLTDAANVHVSHVILATDKLMEQLKDLKGPLVLALLSSSTNDLATMASDYRTSEMIGLADYLRGVGFENIKTIDAPYAEETFEDGTVVAAIDRQQLCRDLGIFVSPVAEEAPAEGDGGE